MKHRLGDLLDLNEMQPLLESFCEVMGVASAIIDLEGKVLIGARWQRICTDFHRSNELTLGRCLESDTCLANDLMEGSRYSVYRCQNGLTDAASPIVIEGEHLANVFVGQFLTEAPDVAFFKRQAAQFGFDEEAYLDALAAVPVVPSGKLPAILRFLTSFSETIATMGLETLRQREAEDALRASEGRFRTVVSASKDAMIAIGHDGRVSLFNPAAQKLFGRTEAEMVGQTLECLMPEEYRESHQKYVEGYFAAGSPRGAIGQTVELPALRRDGTVFPVELSLSEGAYGKERFVLAVIRDITGRRGAEEAVREARDQLDRKVKERTADLRRANETLEAEVAERKRAEAQSQALTRNIEFILGATNTGLDIIDSDFNIRYIDPEWQKAYGDPSGLKCYEYFMGRDSVCPDCGILKALETKTVTVTEEVLPKEDDRPIQVTTIPFQNETGEWLVAEVNVDIAERRRVEEELKEHRDHLEELVAARTDELSTANQELEGEVAERKRAEEALKESEERFRSLVEATSDWIWEMDGEMRYVYSSPSVRELLGYEPDEIVGRTPFALMPDQEVERVRSLAGRLLASGSVISGLENTCMHKDGRLVVLETSGVPIRDSDGKVTGYRGIDRDITERKRTHEAMIQTEKMASVGALAAGMAHEINNPLAGILQSVQVARERLSEDLERNRSEADGCGTTMEAIQAYAERRGILSMIDAVIDSGRRAARIVENLLGFSRRSDSEFALCDLAELLDQTVELAQSDFDLKRRYDFRSIRVVRDYDPGMPQVPCDGTGVRHVMLNLLKNGAQAMAGMTGGGDSAVLSLRLWHDDAMARIEVGDNGPGMDEATCRRVFEPFFTTKAVGEGTGLGLSVSYFIITETHKGTMTVESSPGHGALFTVSLPLTRPGKLTTDFGGNQGQTTNWQR